MYGTASRHLKFDAVDATALKPHPKERLNDTFLEHAPYYREFVRSGLNSPLGLQRFRPIRGSSPATGVVDNEAGSDKLPGSSSSAL